MRALMWTVSWHHHDCDMSLGLKLQFEAQVIITSSVISDKTFAALLESAKKRGTQVIYLPAKDFSYKNGFSRLLTIAREVRPFLFSPPSLRLPIK
jgi:hypothetical protein